MVSMIQVPYSFLRTGVSEVHLPKPSYPHPLVDNNPENSAKNKFTLITQKSINNKRTTALSHIIQYMQFLHMFTTTSMPINFTTACRNPRPERCPMQQVGESSVKLSLGQTQHPHKCHWPQTTLAPSDKVKGHVLKKKHLQTENLEIITE